MAPLYRYREILRQATEQRLRDKHIARFDALVQANHDAPTAESISVFSRHFLSRMSNLELTDMTTDNLYQVVLESWRIFTTHSPGNIHLPRLTIRIFGTDSRKSDSRPGQHTVVVVHYPDIPFITDSILIELSRRDLTLHHMHNMVASVHRNPDGTLADYDPRQQESHSREVLIYAEINHLDREDTEDLERQLDLVLQDVLSAAQDGDAIRQNAQQVIGNLSRVLTTSNQEDKAETIALLQWLLDGNFIFLGYHFSETSPGNTDRDSQLHTNSMLGLCRTPAYVTTSRPIQQLFSATGISLRSNKILRFSKVGIRSRVYRPAYPDHIAVKRFDAHGKVVGEDAFIGLFTPRVYAERPENIPVLRRLIKYIHARAGLDETGFDHRALSQAITTIPRDEMFQATEDQLFDWAMEIARNHERRQVQVYLRESEDRLFFSCLVYTPRSVYTTRLRRRLEKILVQALNAKDVEFNSFFSESILVRTHYVLLVESEKRIDFNIELITEKIRASAFDWIQDLRDRLNNEFPDKRGRFLRNRYENAFPASYQESESPWAAVYDIKRMEQLSPTSDINSRMYYPRDGTGKDTLKLKIFHLGEPLPLSRMLPVLKNLGLTVIEETAYRIWRTDKDLVTIHDMKIVYEKILDLKTLGDLFTAAFIRIWHGMAEDDLFNSLVLSVQIDWRKVTLIRAYARYIKQIRTGFSQNFIASTLLKYPHVVRQLLKYFHLRLAPDGPHDHKALRQDILQEIEKIDSLNEDRVMRRYLDIIDATLRTNFFQAHPWKENYLSFKLSSERIPAIPRPALPLEVFVYSPAMEGVHLRGGSIARGGLRWSDRIEDYRTEILGLVKAQQVKNAIITPMGAKGGFVIKSAMQRQPEKPLPALGIDGYRTFIKGLLDVTDNIDGDVTKPPENVFCRDGDDPYLVIAADKGTSSFSDIANALAIERGFWLGDAFASGGSQGYDHKKLAITARGTWISVRQHFLELGIDSQIQSVSVVGIGDMSGDVFGNGMLTDDRIRLVAAFNHQHIFIDPNPDIDQAVHERKRLFELPDSGWQDYDRQLISPGGGVFSRQAKSIPISPQMHDLFKISHHSLSPDDLVKIILGAPVDMIWNGGIGTFVRASHETNQAADDRQNDNIRIRASDLRCKVFAEGGNLGLTQAARIEYALAGGSLNTDFIDNSAGVDCSDHEVNIKILLATLVSQGKLTQSRRDRLLQEMAPEVTSLVLRNNFLQSQAISVARAHSLQNLSEYSRFLSLMEEMQGLDRMLEVLPSEEQLGERQQSGQGLTRPELAVMISYAKTFLKQLLVGKALTNDPATENFAINAFPESLMKRFGGLLREHPLYHDIVAAQIANDLVNHMGCGFVMHMIEFSGNLEEGMRAWLIARETFDMDDTWKQIEDLPKSIPVSVRARMMLELEQLVRRGTHWLLFHARGPLNIQERISFFKPQVRLLRKTWWTISDNAYSDQNHRLRQWLIKQGVAKDISQKLAIAAGAADALAIVEIASRNNVQPTATAELFSQLARQLGLDLVVARMYQLQMDNHWQAMVKDRIYNELVFSVAKLCELFYASTSEPKQAGESKAFIARWLASLPAFLPSWQRIRMDFNRSAAHDIAMFSMIQRRLADLIAKLDSPDTGARHDCNHSHGHYEEPESRT